MDRAVVEELVMAAKAAIKEWRTQTRMALSVGGEIAVNEGNAVAFTKIEAAIRAAESELNKPVDMVR